MVHSSSAHSACIHDALPPPRCGFGELRLQSPRVMGIGMGKCRTTGPVFSHPCRLPPAWLRASPESLGTLNRLRTGIGHLGTVHARACTAGACSIHPNASVALRSSRPIISSSTVASYALRTAWKTSGPLTSTTLNALRTLWILFEPPLTHKKSHNVCSECVASSCWECWRIHTQVVCKSPFKDNFLWHRYLKIFNWAIQCHAQCVDTVISFQLLDLKQRSPNYCSQTKSGSRNNFTRPAKALY